MWNSAFENLGWDIKYIDKSKIDGVAKRIKDKLNDDIDKVIKIIKANPTVYRLELTSGRVLRLDIRKDRGIRQNIIRIQQFASKFDTCIPKIIFYYSKGKNIFIVSEWIEGKLLYEVSHLDKPFIIMGETMAKLNNLRNPATNLYITTTEASPSNCIWTSDNKIVFIDQDRLKEVKKEVVDLTNLKSLLKRLHTQKRRDLFLEGYGKYKDNSRIIKEAKKVNWKWKKKKV
jgi:aminoglycoside phosphotransferase